MSSTDHEPMSAASYIPVLRIIGNCAFIKTVINNPPLVIGESVYVSVPVLRNVFVDCL